MLQWCSFDDKMRHLQETKNLIVMGGYDLIHVSRGLFTSVPIVIYSRVLSVSIQ